MSAQQAWLGQGEPLTEAQERALVPQLQAQALALADELIPRVAQEQRKHLQALQASVVQRRFAEAQRALWSLKAPGLSERKVASLMEALERVLQDAARLEVLHDLPGLPREGQTPLSFLRRLREDPAHLKRILLAPASGEGEVPLELLLRNLHAWVQTPSLRRPPRATSEWQHFYKRLKALGRNVQSNLGNERGWSEETMAQRRPGLRALVRWRLSLVEDPMDLPAAWFQELHPRGSTDARLLELLASLAARYMAAETSLLAAATWDALLGAIFGLRESLLKIYGKATPEAFEVLFEAMNELPQRVGEILESLLQEGLGEQGPAVQQAFLERSLAELDPHLEGLLG